MIKKKGTVYRLETPATTLVLKADTAQILYYGKKLVSADWCEALRSSPCRLFSEYGQGDFNEQSVLLVNADGGFSTNFVYSKSKILAEKPVLENLPSSYGESKTLELKYVDATKVALYLYYTVFEDTDAIAVSAKIVNGAKKEIHIKKLASVQAELTGRFEFITFDGAWARERSKNARAVCGGTFVNESRAGASSHAHNPFVMAKGEKGVFGFHLLYSGNHKESMTEYDGVTRVIAGINDFMFDWTLGAGEEFCAPEAAMCYAETEDALSRQMHAFAAEHVVRGKWKKRERPVLVNSWEGAYFDFNADSVVEMAKVSKDLGAELFVLDDGWFGRRNDDTSSLGDWSDNVEKLGCTLAELAERVRGCGLKFGIWIEPEMISEESELFRSRPAYAMRVPGRTPVRLRNQLALNMADEKVQNFVVRTVSDVISRCGASYVKWDYNRMLTDCFGKGVAAGEYFHRYMLGVYKVISKVVKRFPFVLFEGCAGGGARFDLGMMSYFPQVWTSDNTDARDRLQIQDGSSYGYPQSVMGAHVSASPNHQSGDSHPLETRFNVACGGLLGYELDVRKLSEKDKKTVAAQISFYKEHRKLLQFGNFYRLGDSFGGDYGGFISVSPDRGAAIAVIAAEKRTNVPPPRVAFKGLNPAYVYEVTARRQENYENSISFTAGGDVLVSGELFFPDFYDDASARENSGCMYTRMFLVKKQKSS